MAKTNKNLTRFSYPKYIFAIFLFILVSVNFVSAVFFSDQQIIEKSNISSLSKGVSYNSVLNFWLSTVKSHDWDSASKLEKYIYHSDIDKYLRLYHPNFLEIKAQDISQKKEITNEDYMELAKIYTNIGQYQNATDALFKARQIDLLRSDIEKISLLY